MSVYMKIKVTVLLAVYNGERYLTNAIESILAQTFSDFEFLIIDDGSNDGTKDILGKYAKEKRIVLIRNKENIGLTNSLNKGLKFARGDYIARQDADDISLPDRLKRQVNFLDSNAGVAILGTNLKHIDSMGTPMKRQPKPYPTSSGVLSWMLFFRNCLQHPTVMMRRNVTEKLGGYNAQLPLCQDYELWLRASFKYRLSNLPDILVKYRCHTDNLSVRQRELQQRISDSIVLSSLNEFLGKKLNISTVQTMRNGERAVGSRLAIEACQILVELKNKCEKQYCLTTGDKRTIQRKTALRICRIALTQAHRPKVFTRILNLLAKSF